MRRLFLLLITLLPLCGQAQPNITYSNNTFPEPESGWDKIILLKNGKTVYISGNSSDMTLRVYGKDRQSLNVKELQLKNNVEGGIKGKDQWLEHAFEQNGNVVMFVAGESGCGMGGQINCVQSLYRFVIDPNEGKIVKGDKLCETAKVRSWGYNLDKITVNDIFIARDPVSDMYAVLVFNGYTEDMPDRVKLMTYNGDNQLVKTAVLNAPSTQDRAVHYAGMCMNNKTVYLGTNMRNAKEKGLNVPLCISVLKDGADDFETTVLKISPFAINSDCKMAFNRAAGLLELLITTETSKKNTSGFFANGSETTHYYVSGLALIDPATMEVKFAGAIDGSLADAYAKQKLGEKNGFNGVLPSFHMNADNTTTVIPEEQYTYTQSSRGGGYVATMVDKVGVIKLDNTGKAAESYVIRIRENNSQGSRYAAPWTYFSYRYINTPKASYILLNDLKENFSKPESAKPHGIQTISDASTVLYKMVDGKVEKSYLWGVPEKRSDNKFAMIGTATYDQESQTFATILVDAKDKKARLAWATFD